MVLECQNGELLHASNQASYRMLEILVNITDQSRLQQQTLATILSNGQADSALLKALSIVATVCLPASLIAVSFTSHS
jgi:Mg2+ and Co2+ transporter CorA